MLNIINFYNIIRINKYKPITMSIFNTHITSRTST